MAQQQSSLFVICTADGSIYSIDAWTGEFQHLIDAGSPLITHKRRQRTENPSLMVPGLDGTMYWREKDNLQPLPLTIDNILDHPVRSCADDADCGILTATAHTSLIAVNANSGSLAWKTPTETCTAAQKNSVQAPVVILQRKDYLVGEVSTRSGQQTWNATLGTFQALEFDEASQDIMLLPKPLPGVLFSNSGKTLSGVDPESQFVLWQIDTPAVVASLFGLDGGRWATVQVLQPSDVVHASEQDELIVPQFLLPSPVSQDTMDHSQLWRTTQQHHRFTLTDERSRMQVRLEYLDEQCPGGNCQKIPLELPAPPEAPKPEGLLISWTIVSLIIGFLIVGTILGRLWYIRKRREWREKASEEASKELPPETGNASFEQPTSNSNVENERTLPMTRYSRYESEFQELQRLGKGGFGTVFQCKNSLDGRDYAIKKILLRGNQASFDERLERVLREVKILALLDHPHIVRYYTAWLQSEDDADETSVGDDEPTMSRRFSSSLLTEMAEWKQPRRLEETSSRFGESMEPSFYPRPHYFKEVSDCGFIFEDSAEDKESHLASQPSESKTKLLKIGESSRSADRNLTNDLGSSSDHRQLASDKTVRHILYIQMQLCKQETLSDYLSDRGARETGGAVDIPKALGLFCQIVQAVEHVHTQGLIHRDLKPLNCFIDESGNVKVGDFGLSREATGNPDEDPKPVDSSLVEQDQTAGVGTRSYASPEQMSGSDYDSSTDVFSLGIILFELCYPMYTGMERNVCLSRLRNDGSFPSDWSMVVGGEFPSLQPLILSMTDTCPADRPTAVKVAQLIQSIVGQFTIQSLDLKRVSDTILLRVEAEQQDDALQNTMQCIQDFSIQQGYQTEVVQYGLRSSQRDGIATAVMEFALRSHLDGKAFVQSLEKRPEIHVARQVSSN